MIEDLSASGAALTRQERLLFEMLYLRRGVYISYLELGLICTGLFESGDSRGNLQDALRSLEAKLPGYRLVQSPKADCVMMRP